MKIQDLAFLNKKQKFYLQVAHIKLNEWLNYRKMFIRSRLRLFWYRLWIRKDKFHRSLNTDMEALLTMNKEQKEKYLADLLRRRKIAYSRYNAAHP